MNGTWLESGAPIAAEDLNTQGVFYRSCPTAPGSWQNALDELKQERGYVEQDEICLSPDTPDLEALCQKFVAEHYHDDDEVRFVLDGNGVFDIRAHDGRWMRVEVEPGDLIVVPKERNHRFFLTDARTIRCVRLFRDRSGWVPHYAEEQP